MPQKLMESNFINLVALEESSASGRLVAEGEFGRCDVPTQNGRIYPRKLMEREIERLAPELKERGVTGELDHPSDGKQSLQRTSHVITGLKIEDDGRVIGKCEILETPMGNILRALIKGKVKVGVSSRGYGSTAPSSGKHEGEEVQEDFVLKTYDFVADPAMKSAIPLIRTEDVDDKTVAEMFMAEFPEIAQALTEGHAVSCELTEGAEGKAKQTRKEIEEQVRAEMSENFERQLRDELVEMRAEVANELREEFEADPETGAAKGILAAIAEMVGAYRDTPEQRAVQDALKSKDLEVAEAKTERDEAAAMALKAANMLHIERKIGKHPMVKSIREFFKGKAFESTEDADKALETFLSELPKSDEVVSKEEAAYREENAKLRGEVNLLESKVEELTGKVVKVAKLSERIDAQRMESEDEAASLVEQANQKVAEAEARVAKAVEAAADARAEAKQRIEESELRVYKLEKVVGLPNGRELIGLMESVKDEATVDEMVKRQGVTRMSDPNLEHIRNSVKGRTSNAHQLDEDAARPRGSSNVDGFDMDELALLSGIGVGKS